MKRFVVHIKKAKYDVYIGRQSGQKFHFGNPFTHKNGTLASVVLETRIEAIKAFKDWLLGVAWHEVEPERRQWILENLHNLRGKILGCHCSPDLCHGHVMSEMVNGKDVDENVFVVGD